LVAGDKLYAPREDGVVFVGQINSDGFKVLSETNLEQPVIGSPIPFGNGVLIRGESQLMYFGD
jgi:hypothetical protein